MTEFINGNIDNDELVAFSTELIRTPSQSFHENKLAELLVKKLEQIGLDVRLEGGNVIASLESGNVGKNIVLCGHLDTVPVGNENEWTVDPYGGEVSDGKLWGLGSADMKGGLAAQVFAIKALKTRALKMRGKVTLIATVLEETGPEKVNPPRGILELIDKGLLNADITIVGEPTSLIVARGHKGMCNIDLTLHGKSAHSSVPDKGINAIEKMANAIAALKSLKCKDHVELGSGTLTTCVISGGVKLSMVPDTCRVLLDRRLTVGESAEAVKDEIMRTLNDLKKSDANFDFEVEFPYSYDAFLTPTDDPAISCLGTAIRGVTGRSPIVGTIPFGTDGAWVNKLTKCPVLVFGPGNIANAHRPDENVVIEEVEAAAKIYTAMIAKYLS